MGDMGENKLQRKLFNFINVIIITTAIATITEANWAVIMNRGKVIYKYNLILEIP